MKNLLALPPQLATALIVCIAAWLPAAQVHAQADACGSLTTHYGPYDYRTDRNKLPIVEKHHFSPAVENLIQDPNWTPVGGHLAYTLNAFPNHHRALASVVRYGERTRTAQPRYLEYSVDCYFERALRFRPDDTVVRLLFADYLARTKRTSEAIPHIDYARAAATDNPLTQYNVGLLYVEVERYDDALRQAHLAMAQGVTLDGLKKKLEEKGRWVAPKLTAADSASGAASSSAHPQ